MACSVNREVLIIIVHEVTITQLNGVCNVQQKLIYVLYLDTCYSSKMFVIRWRSINYDINNNNYGDIIS